MKKILYSILIAGLALASASCQKVDEKTVNPDNTDGQSTSPALTVTGSIVNFDATKVTYNFEENSPKSGIKAEWEEDDTIFGFDNGVGDNKSYFTFTIKEIKDGKAIFNTNGYEHKDGVDTLYAVYYPGTAFMDSKFTLDVNLSSQNGTLGSNTPAIMVATGTIEDGRVNFEFSNETAIIGIYAMQILDNEGKTVSEGTEISGITLNGVVTTGKIGKGATSGKMILSKGTETGSISATGLELKTDKNGFITVKQEDIKPYFAVIPGNSEISVTATAKGGAVYRNLTTIASESLNAGTYYYIGKQLGTKVVASIGEGESKQEFATIDDAFRAVADEQTIKLEDDCAFATEVTLKGKSGNVTLNLNGHTLTNNGNNRINLNNADATLTIVGGKELGAEKDGTITTNDLDAAVIKVTAGNLIVNSGEILVNDSDETTSSGKSAIWVQNTAANPPVASVTINGGKITGSSNAAKEKRCYALYVENTNASVSITSGEFSSQSNNLRINKASSVNITGGTFNSPTSSGEYTIRLAGDYTCNISGEETVVYGNTYPVYITSGTITLNVSGGSYSSNSNHVSKAGSNASPISITGGKFSYRSSCLASLPEGYGLSKITDDGYKYAVSMSEGGCDAEFTTGTQTFKYVTVTDAFDDVSGTCTVKLLADHTMTKKLNLGYLETSPAGTMTLDLNGHTLYSDSGEKRIQIQPNKKTASVKIIDSTTDKQGKYTQSEAAATAKENLLTIGYGGTFTLESGTVDTGTASIYCQNSKVYIEGGTVTGNCEDGSIYCLSSSAKVYIKDGIVTSTGNCAVCAEKGTVSITGGTVKSDADINNIPAIKIDGGTVTVDGESALVTLPNLANARAATPIVQVESGTLTLKNGTIGGISGDVGNQTAVRLVNGTFTMEGGSIVARRHAITLNNSKTTGGATVTITGGELYNVNNASDYSLIRFAGTYGGTVTIGGQNTGPYLFSIKTDRLFGVGSTGDITTAYKDKITVTNGFFNEDLSSSFYSGKVTLNGTCTQLTSPVPGPSGKSYDYQVTPNE